MKCEENCPCKAIKAKKGSFVVAKSGFDLDAVKSRMEGVPLEPVDNCCKGLLWIGVKNYLEDKD